MENEMVKAEAQPVAPQQMYRMATDVAGVCKEIVSKTAKKIGNRKYVTVEGWQAIATAHGCVLSIESVTESESGDCISIAELRRMSDGVILARAEGFVGMDEKTWASRTRHARRAMAQTRAMSRTARSAFAHVVVLIDAGLSTTPAEEMDFSDNHEPRNQVDQALDNNARDQKGDPDEGEMYMIALAETFEAAGFTEDQAAQVTRAVLKKKKALRIENLPATDRAALLKAIKDGAFDKVKKEAAHAGV